MGIHLGYMGYLLHFNHLVPWLLCIMASERPCAFALPRYGVFSISKVVPSLIIPADSVGSYNSNYFIAYFSIKVYLI